MAKTWKNLTEISFMRLIINNLVQCVKIGTGHLPPPKRPEKTVDLNRNWVYIHECHPFKGSFSTILRAHLRFPASY